MDSVVIIYDQTNKQMLEKIHFANQR